VCNAVSDGTFTYIALFMLPGIIGNDIFLYEIEYTPELKVTISHSIVWVILAAQIIQVLIK
jgi:hypothetical protein